MSSLELFLMPACFFAAVYDFLFYKIPNWLVAMLISVFYLKSGLNIMMGEPLSILVHPSITFVVFLVVGFLLFAIGIMGAGDAKLLAACSLWTTEINSMHFIMLVAFSGGILATCYLIFKKPLAFIRELLLSKIVNKFESVPLIIKEENMVPYAVAIFGGLAWLIHNNG